jgi:thioredoxin reductase
VAYGTRSLLRKSMSSYLAGRIDGADSVELFCHSEIRQMLGDKLLEAVEIENIQTGERTRLSTPAVFSFIGADPHTGWLRRRSRPKAWASSRPAVEWRIRPTGRASANRSC